MAKRGTELPGACHRETVQVGCTENADAAVRDRRLGYASAHSTLRAHRSWCRPTWSTGWCRNTHS